MKVRVKQSESPQPTKDDDAQLVTDPQLRLDCGYASNRLIALTKSKHTLADFVSFLPVICFTCRRTRKPDQVFVGVDLSIRCVDRDECQRYWPGYKEPVVEENPPKKSKYKVKGK